jgi:hypothetical protein
LQPTPSNTYFAAKGFAFLEKTKRPPGNKGSLSFQGRIVLTEEKPSKLSGEILWAEKAECQEIFGREIALFSATYEKDQ